MIVAVTGGRDFWIRSYVFEVLDDYDERKGIEKVLHGACCRYAGGPLTGADRWADEWGQGKNPERNHRYPAFWGCNDYEHATGFPCVTSTGSHRGAPHGKFAGPARNRRMLETGKPDLLIAFEGGIGTANCISTARDLGIEVLDLG